MKLYIPLSIAFLILISIASGAVGDVNIKDTGNARGLQQASLIGSDLQPVSAQSFTTGSVGNYQSNSALAQAKGSGYPVPPINSPTDEQLTAENLGLTIPQMDSFTPDESLDFISVSGPSGLVMPSGSSAARRTGSGSSVWYYPSSVASANRFYVQSNFGLQTVGGCGYRGYLPLWADIKTSGNFYVYEWYPGQSIFYTVQPRDVWAFLSTASRDSADFKINEAVPLLFAVFSVSLAATILVLLLPPLLLRTRLPRQTGVLGFLTYFVFIGAGYILIEVGLIQRFVLFLGHPTYALTVVIFSMLISSGAGSLASERLVGRHEGKLIKTLGLIAVMAAALALAVTIVLPAAVGLPLPVKIPITVGLIGPLGFVMGLPFPTGLKRLEEWHAPSVRWAWSLNAASSVLGSALALVCSIYLGLVQTLMAGGLLYLAALAVVARVRMAPAITPEPGSGRVLLGQ